VSDQPRYQHDPDVPAPGSAGYRGRYCDECEATTPHANDTGACKWCKEGKPGESAVPYCGWCETHHAGPRKTDDTYCPGPLVADTPDAGTVPSMDALRMAEERSSVLREAIDETLTELDMLRAENEQLRALLRDRLDATAAEVLVIDGMRAARRLVRAVRRRMTVQLRRRQHAQKEMADG